MILSELLQKHSPERSWCTWWLTQDSTAYGQMLQWSTQPTGAWMKQWFSRCQLQTSNWCFLVWIVIVFSVYCFFSLLKWLWCLLRSFCMTFSYMLQTQVAIYLAVLELLVWELLCMPISHLITVLNLLSDNAPLIDSLWSSAVSSFACVFVTTCHNPSF